MDEAREKHDELLKNKPEGAVHDEANCKFCNDTSDSTEGGDMKTFSEEELNAAVAAAVAPIQAELDELKEGEVDTRVAEAQAEAERRVGEIQAQLDEAMAQKGAAENELAETISFLEAEEASRIAEAEAAARLTERKTSIEELAVFDTEYVEANIARWGSIDEEAFVALLDDWKTLAASKPKEKAEEEGDPALGDTVLDQTRDEASSDKDVFGDILNARTSGVDIHSIY